MSRQELYQAHRVAKKGPDNAICSINYSVISGRPTERLSVSIREDESQYQSCHQRRGVIHQIEEGDKYLPCKWHQSRLCSTLSLQSKNRSDAEIFTPKARNTNAEGASVGKGMSIFNRIQNHVFFLLMAQLLRRYRSSDIQKTALVLLDTKPVSLATQKGLQDRLMSLVNTCRASGLTVIFSNFSERSVQRKPPAGVQRLLDDSRATAKDQHPDLGPKAGDIVLEPRETLSIFFDKTLEPTLQDRGIEHLVFAGSYVDLSIQSSARHSSENGFHTTVLEDCCGSMMEGGHAPSTRVTLPKLVHEVLSANQWLKIMKLN